GPARQIALAHHRRGDAVWRMHGLRDRLDQWRWVGIARERLDADDASVADLGLEGPPIRGLGDKTAGQALHRRAGQNSSVKRLFMAGAVGRISSSTNERDSTSSAFGWKRRSRDSIGIALSYSRAWMSSGSPLTGITNRIVSSRLAAMNATTS